MKSFWKIFIVVAIAFSSFAFVTSNNAKKIVIVIDAGHGGNDMGASHNAQSEKIIVDQIVKKIKSQNTNPNLVIHLTRSDDQSISLLDRTKFSNNLNPDLLLSLHVNASQNKETSGIALYFPKEGNQIEASNAIAVKLGNRLSENLSLKLEEVKEGPFLMLKNATSPAVILELGYLTNDSDRSYLTDDKAQDRIAATILSFLSDLK